MSTIRATKAYQTQPKSDVSSVDLHSSKHIERAHDADGIHGSSEQATSQQLENKRLFHESMKNNIHHDAHESKQLASSSKKTSETVSSNKSHIDFYSDKEDDLKVNESENNDDVDDSGEVKKETALPSQGIGMGLNSGMPVAKNEKSDELSDLLSAAMSSLGSLASSKVGTENTQDSKLSLLKEIPELAIAEAPKLSIEEAPESSESSEPSIEGSSKDSVEESPGFSTAAAKGQSIADFKTEGSLGSSAALGGSLSKPVAAALRTARFTDFLSELTATVTQARLNSANGQDISLQLRSDILEGTNVHVTANATHMEVAFSTVNAASNALLNSHLTTLQNHLVTLCPGQTVEVKNQFLASPNSSEFNNEREGSKDDLASFNQGNRGNWRDNDDTL